MSEIYGSATLDVKKAIESVGDVVATVQGKRCVVSANGFEHKITGRDTRLLAKSVDEQDDSVLRQVRVADAPTQTLIDAVDWPHWPQANMALPKNRPT